MSLFPVFKRKKDKDEDTYNFDSLVYSLGQPFYKNFINSPRRQAFCIELHQGLSLGMEIPGEIIYFLTPCCQGYTARRGRQVYCETCSKEQLFMKTDGVRIDDPMFREYLTDWFSLTESVFEAPVLALELEPLLLEVFENVSAVSSV